MHGWSIGDLVRSLLGRSALPKWPPDVFAVAATVLAETGGYVHATRLGTHCGREGWHSQAQVAAERWSKSPLNPPRLVRELWAALRERWSIPIAELTDNVELCITLVKLLAVSDTACAGFGIDIEGRAERTVLTLLAQNQGRSLTQTVNTDRARVLPKQHTPQNGLTLRSLSHHLALIRPRGVVARWSAPLSFSRTCDDDIINILVCPWPKSIKESDFRVLPRAPEHDANHPSAPHRFFSFDPSTSANTKPLETQLEQRLDAARRCCGDIHLIVFPELALDDRQLAAVRKVAYANGSMLVAGVRHLDKTNDAKLTRNTCFVDSAGLAARRFDAAEREELAELFSGFGCFQDKHHRWSLDWRQVRQYGLGSRLPGSRQCWEWTPIHERRLHFWTISQWLTWAPLICEDLARQDPVADILRSVAPNLVIALLMDGPQLAARWSARFATVLAEDPGSSVLTLTCLGMAERSRGPDNRQGDRTIALWRDSVSGIHELALPKDHDAGVLSISPVRKREWTADGRHDGGVSSTPVFAGFTPLPE